MSTGPSKADPSKSEHGREIGIGCAMDLRHLEELVGQLVESSIAPSTKRVYLSGQRRYLAFCGSTGSSPLPLTEHQACLFVAHLMETCLKHSTIKGYLSAVRSFADSSLFRRPIFGLLAAVRRYA